MSRIQAPTYSVAANTAEFQSTEIIWSRRSNFHDYTVYTLNQVLVTFLPAEDKDRYSFIGSVSYQS